MRLPLHPLLLGAAGALLALVGCNRLATQPQWYASPTTCLEHDACGPGRACVETVCVDDEGGPFDPGDLDATPWFARADGTCTWDSECGPWVCVAGACTAPSAVDRALPARTELRFWDGSCAAHDDCGPWFCADGWCTAPGHVDPTAALPEPVLGEGRRCTADASCDPGQDCVSPGYCRDGSADESMTWRDVAWDGDGAYPDASCNFDTDCGARICVEGWCQAADMAGVATPPRSAFEYYDGSCAGDADCGPWRCLRSWCRDPGRVGAAQQGPGDRLAARAMDDGALDEAGLPLPEWIEQNTTPTTSDTVSDVDPYKDDYVLGALSSSGSFGTLSAISGGLGGGLGLSGSGTGTGGLLGGPTWMQATHCGSHLDCGPTEACVAPGVCQPNLRGTPFTTADITAYSSAGQFCDTDRDCGPMTCVSNSCVPTEDTGVAMPLREEIYYFDGSCYDASNCGPWTCIEGWCRP